MPTTMPKSVCVIAMLAALSWAGCDDSKDATCDRSGSLAVDLVPVGHAHDHDEDPCAEEGEFGPPTGATCPAMSTLTYESFGKPFMEKYCTSCHASTLTGDARQGAPLYHDFDSKDGILAVADHVELKAASGPDATNELMPIGSGPKPTKAERAQLGEWLACELAAMQ